MDPQPTITQRNQPPGVPPLTLTGERTLPDIPVENYWYRRHLIVYETIAAQITGLRVVDLACGEGYGAATLARTAKTVTGVDANPETHEHARLRYTQNKLNFEQQLIEEWQGPVEAVVFLQTIEHLEDPHNILAHCKQLIAEAENGVVYISTPNVLTLAAKGAQHSGNPWHKHEYRAAEFRALCRDHFTDVDILGVFHARKLALHQYALDHLRWDDIHRKLGISRRFYDRFIPAITAQDFALRRDRPLDSALDFVAICRP